MFALVKNDLSSKTLNILKKEDITPILLYEITSTDLLENKFIKGDQSRKTCLLIEIIEINNKIITKLQSIRHNFDMVAAKGISNKTNRFIIENLKPDIFLDPHISDTQRYDFVHHFNSGLNHVLAKISKENNISFFFSLNFIESKNQDYRIIGRINQNISLLNKYGVIFDIGFIISDFNHIKSRKEVQHILSLINGSKVSDILCKSIEKNEKRKNNFYIQEGIILE